MPGFHIRVLVAILTFAVGVAGVWLIGLVPTVGIPLLGRVAPGLAFWSTARGCGNGYGQAYQLPDGQRMWEGSSAFETEAGAQAEFRAEVAKATKVIERTPGFKNRRGEEGERVVLSAPDEDGKERTRVLWYGGGRFYLWIDAPSQEIALAFEQSNAYAY